MMYYLPGQFKVDSAGSGKVSGPKQANAGRAPKLERSQTMRLEA
jgi:hypothetical protein